MTPRLYVSKTEASYFIKNKMGASNTIPTEGTYAVGDFIVSTTQANEIFGWVCVEAGSPGVWKEICGISDILEKIEKCKSDINGIETKINTHNVIVENIKDSSILFNQKVTELNDSMTELKSSNKTLIDKMSAIEVQNNDIRIYINETIDKIEELDIAQLAKAIDETTTLANNNKLRIDSLEGNAESISNRVSQAENSITNLNKQVEPITTIQKDISDLQELLGETAADGEQQASGLQQQIQDMRNDLDDLQDLIGETAADGEQQTSGLQKQIQDMRAELDEINEILGNTAGSDEVDGAIKQINTNKTDIATLKTKVDTNTAGISTNKTNIATNATNITKNASSISTNATNITQNASSISTNKTNIATNTSNITKNTNNINTNKTDIATLKTKVSALESSSSSNTDTSSALDINSKNISSSGSLSTDSYASHGKAYTATSSSSNVNLYTSTMSDVKYGHYAICLRMKSNNNSSTSNIVRLTVYNGSTAILTKNFKGTDFSTNSNYVLLYSTFEYTGISSTKNNLKIQVDILPVSGITVSFDYAYISMIIPAVFL